jgi:putative tryptophan/tyrosine transport system substrate-binding protein
MDRRHFLLTSLAGAVAAPLAAEAQQPRKVARIGIISAGATAPMIGPLIGPEASLVPFTAALLRGLRELGDAYGTDFVTEPRGTEGRTDTIAPIVADLVRLKVDVIVAGGSALDALKQATSTIPVVMPGSNDPVGQGYVRSLSHPGGNFTGLSFQTAETTGKRLQLLKELVPGAASVAVLWDRPDGLPAWQAAKAAARERGWKVLSLEIRDPGDLEGALKAATKARVGALLVYAGRTLTAQSRRVAELAAKSRLPAMYSGRFFADNGGLISYGADQIEVWRRTAVFVDRMGLTIPPSLLARADQVIE